MIRRQRAALVARHRERPAAAEVRAELADGWGGADGAVRAEREGVADELRGHTQVDAFDALARRIAVELLVAALER